VKRHALLLFALLLAVVAGLSASSVGARPAAQTQVVLSTLFERPFAG